MDESENRDRPTLLLVDDDETFREVAGAALDRHGFDVSLAPDIATAMDIARSSEPEYAVVDLRIGQESGLELVRQLIELDPNTRIVILTGFASIATAVEAIKLGARHYLTKPAGTGEIISALHHDEGDSGAPVSDHPISVKRLEWEHLQKVLMDNDGNISAAARALGMHRRTLQRKLAKNPVRR